VYAALYEILACRRSGVFRCWFFWA